MLRSTLCVLALGLSFTAAHAAHGTVVPIPGYDYKQEKKDGYVKSYCEDSIGNHVACPAGRSDYKAEVKQSR